MISNYVPVTTPSGQTIWIEIEETVQEDGFSLASGEGKKVLKGFQETVEALKDNAGFVLEQLKGLAPKEVEVEFGITVGVEGKTPFFALAKATGEANYTIKLKWVREESEQPVQEKQVQPLLSKPES
ncbi:MAG: hypothetical protein H6652_00440 [Ardenticatenaceae bacterium]|nr:hypothetical protein [Ardenticatenaceae bacterium]